MLVLSRKENPKIVVDGRITITVVQVRGSRVGAGYRGPGGDSGPAQ